VSFSPDGRWFAAPALDGFKVWDTGTWRETYVPLSRTGTLRQYGRVEFTSTGKRLMIQVGADVRVWDSEAWREVVTRSKPPFPNTFRLLSLGQNGHYAATADWNGSVRLWYLSPVVVPRGAAPR
jgi:WD40 repeat protein